MSESPSDAAESVSPETVLSGRTDWGRQRWTPLRSFLRTETGSASVLAGATITALVWANVSASSYDTVLGDPAGGFRRPRGRDA